MLCPRKPHWPTLLVILGASWIVATFLTAAGIYMVIFHVHAQQAQMFDRSDQLRTVWMPKNTDNTEKGGWWTVQGGRFMLISGCLFNGMLLSTMLVFLLIERRHTPNLLNQVQEPPPDYETLIKEETPPPSYSELDLISSAPFLSSSSSSVVPVWRPLPPLSFTHTVTAV